jgi:hypothetical protein
MHVGHRGRTDVVRLAIFTETPGGHIGPPLRASGVTSDIYQHSQGLFSCQRHRS